MKQCCFISAVTSTPQNFAVIPREHNITFSWSPPSPTGRNGVITGYSLSCVPEAGQGNSISMQYTAAGTFTLGGFTPATSYNCSISASNSQGSGPAACREVVALDDGEIMHVYILNPRYAIIRNYLHQLHHPYTFMATSEGIFLLRSCHALNAYINATFIECYCNKCVVAIKID